MDSKMKKNLLLMVVVWVWAIAIITASKRATMSLQLLMVKWRNSLIINVHCKMILNSQLQLL